MINWLTEHTAEVLSAIGIMGGLCVFAWKLLGNWLKVNYVTRKEHETALDKLQSDFANDLQKSTDAGIQLSNYMNSQLRILQTALLNIKAPKDE